MENQKKRIPFGHILIAARYLLPLFSAFVFVVVGFLNIVYIDGFTARYHTSLWQLYFNVFSVAQKHFATGGTAQGDELFTLLVIGSVVGLVVLAVALGLICLAAITAYRALRAEKTSEVCRRMKMIHRVAFPNRFCLFLPQLLLIIPTLYANFYAAVSEYYALTGLAEVLTVRVNLPLMIQGVLAALTLVVAILSPRYERATELDMYTFYQSEEPCEDDPDEDDPDEE